MANRNIDPNVKFNITLPASSAEKLRIITDKLIERGDIKDSYFANSHAIQALIESWYSVLVPEEVHA